ncbi:MAG TPA: hypothetical protein VMU49_06110 [Candidatus Acidoferrales bacterium]|nr:hypothetical protein [Candidatus Acidoferrales bacterium]
MGGTGRDPHIYLGEPDEDLIEELEPDQLLSEANQALPRKQLSAGASLGLWGLRVFVIAMTALLVYAFVVALLQQPH